MKEGRWESAEFVVTAFPSQTPLWALPPDTRYRLALYTRSPWSLRSPDKSWIRLASLAIENDLHTISLTSIYTRTLERIETLGDREILQHIGPCLDKRQFGALKGRSAVHALVEMIHIWHKALDQRQSVWRYCLLTIMPRPLTMSTNAVVIRKLMAFGLNDILVRWFCSFLKDRQQRVVVGTHTCMSDFTTLTGAMPQWSWLGSWITHVPCLNYNQPNQPLYSLLLKFPVDSDFIHPRHQHCLYH